MPTSAISPLIPPQAPGVLAALDAVHEALQLRALALARLERDADPRDPAVTLDVAHHGSVDLHRLPAARVGEREAHLLSDRDTLPARRDQHAAVTDVAGLPCNFARLAGDLRRDPGPGSRCATPPRVDQCGRWRPGDRAKRLEPLAHHLRRPVELHGDPGRCAHLCHLGRDRVNHLAGQGEPLAREGQEELDAHAFEELGGLLGGDEDSSMGEVRGVLLLERLGALEVHPQGALGPAHTLTSPVHRSAPAPCRYRQVRGPALSAGDGAAPRKSFPIFAKGFPSGAAEPGARAAPLTR